MIESGIRECYGKPRPSEPEAYSVKMSPDRAALQARHPGTFQLISTKGLRVQEEGGGGGELLNAWRRREEEEEEVMDGKKMCLEMENEEEGKKTRLRGSEGVAKLEEKLNQESRYGGKGESNSDFELPLPDGSSYWQTSVFGLSSPCVDWVGQMNVTP
ncbi:unnamed protein product [Pleuronectes platessa]|uniref:Uncharacterized protein n=1 Tax=Pleuronectes platessa TaxID=8262 RepID=A0A9N7VD50_PLEPL|nr:unnamed protein product [Pleuronectes platessa]